MVRWPEWTTHPIPGVSLSAGGLLALADLSTVAQRTVITGGSTWLDTLLLAPGLHYQQAADELARRSGSNAILSAVQQVHGGEEVTFSINNAATADYIRRIARPGETIILDVGCVPITKRRFFLRRSPSGMHATIWAIDDIPDLGWLSHVLYLTSPVLTIAAVVLTILLRDCKLLLAIYQGIPANSHPGWALASLVALMVSRLLNIWVIKQRTKRDPIRPTSPHPEAPGAESSTDSDQPSSPSPAIAISTHRHSHSHHHLRARVTEYIVSLGDGKSSVKLRGAPEDLRAITADAWLRSKTYVEGYLEAAAKLIVFLVAAVSGNMTQAGAIVMMALLLITAGLLALSNANAKSFHFNGRVAAPEEEGGPGGTRTAKGLRGHVVEGRLVDPAGSGSDGRGGIGEAGGRDDLAEKGQVGYSTPDA